jgi:UDP-glucose 4-epimerase
MRALVFGGNGFIGSHLVDSLLDEGHFVRVFDRMPERSRSPLPNVDYHVGQFGDAFSMAEALSGIDLVYHLVSTTLPATSNLDPVGDIKDNLIATIVLLDQMIKAGVKRIVYLSSGGTVYGNPQSVPISEEHPLHPICSYGIIKATIENYLFMYQQLYGLEPIVIRPSNPFGPRQGHIGVQGLIATFLKKIYDNEPLTVWGDGSVIRDYLYVSDLAHLCQIAGQSIKTGVFNAGYGEGYSINQIIGFMTEVLDIHFQTQFKPGRSLDVKEVVLDIEKCKEQFGWSPEVTIQSGIKKHWDWLQDTASSTKI